MSKNEIELPKGLGTIWPEDAEQAPITAYFTAPKQKNYPVKWLLLWQGNSEIGVSMTEQAEMEKPLTQTEYRVRDWIMGTIGLGNFVYVNQAEMARRLRIQKADASRAIKELIKRQILIAGPKSGRSNTYMINPAFCFSGGLGNGVKERQEVIKATKKAKVIPFKSGKLEQTNLLDHC